MITFIDELFKSALKFVKKVWTATISLDCRPIYLIAFLQHYGS